MSVPVEAVFENGLLRPLTPLPFANQQRVWIRVEPQPQSQAERLREFNEWLKGVEEHQAAYLANHPPLPDSTPDIAADRRRDG
jgi:predicted DNA-binding antitoxin AbrB/MazE fold protein